MDPDEASDHVYHVFRFYLKQVITVVIHELKGLNHTIKQYKAVFSPTFTYLYKIIQTHFNLETIFVPGHIQKILNHSESPSKHFFVVWYYFSVL